MGSADHRYAVDGDSGDTVVLEGPFTEEGDADGDGYVEYRRGAIVVSVAARSLDTTNTR